MARRRGATKSGDLLVMSVVGLVTYSVYRQSLPPVWGVLAVAVLMTWMDRRDKRDALFAAIRLRKPGLFFTVISAVAAVIALFK